MDVQRELVAVLVFLFCGLDSAAPATEIKDSWYSARVRLRLSGSECLEFDAGRLGAQIVFAYQGSFLIPNSGAPMIEKGCAEGSVYYLVSASVSSAMNSRIEPQVMVQMTCESGIIMRQFRRIPSNYESDRHVSVDLAELTDACRQLGHHLH
jgi:hypothetical protein